MNDDIRERLDAIIGENRVEYDEHERRFHKSINSLIEELVLDLEQAQDRIACLHGKVVTAEKDTERWDAVQKLDFEVRRANDGAWVAFQRNNAGAYHGADRSSVRVAVDRAVACGRQAKKVQDNS